MKKRLGQTCSSLKMIYTYRILSFGSRKVQSDYLDRSTFLLFRLI